MGESMWHFLSSQSR